MPKDVFRNRIFAFDGRRVSPNSNSFSVPLARPVIDSGCYEDGGAQKILAGLRSNTIGFSGATEGELESALLARYADASPEIFQLLMTHAAALGDLAIFQEAILTGFTQTHERGAMASFDCTLQSNGDLYFGKILHNPVGTSGIQTGAPETTAVELGALGAGQVLAVAASVVNPPGVSGTTPQLVIEIESDGDSGMATPLVQVTFTAFTAVGSQLMIVDGDDTAISDTHYRCSWSVTGTDNPTFYPMVSAAIIDKET